MIVRQWKARSTPEGAKGYKRHFVGTVYPELVRIPGFVGARLLAHRSEDEVELTVHTSWSSMDAIRRFAGDEPEKAVVEPIVAKVVTAFDDRVIHHECLFEGKPSS